MKTSLTMLAAKSSHVLAETPRPSVYHRKPKVYHTETITRKPKHWKMKTNFRDECVPTRSTYRLSRTTNRCPREARIREQGCCASREAGGNSDDVSLEFLRQLNDIYVFATEEKNPRALERVLQWIKYLPGDSDVVLDPIDWLTVDMSSNDRFIDLLKFCLMSRSDVRLVGHSHHMQNGCIYDFDSLTVDRRCEHFDDIVRVTNEVGVGEFVISGAGGQMTVVPPVRADTLKVNGVINFQEITNHLRTAITNEWNRVNLNFKMEGFTVITSTTTTSEVFHSMFNALKGTKSNISAKFSMYNGVDEIPPGYIALQFPRKVKDEDDDENDEDEFEDRVDISSILTLIASSATDFEVQHYDDKSFEIDYFNEELFFSFDMEVFETGFGFNFYLR